MSTYIGTTGALMKVSCPSALSSGGGRAVSFSDTQSRRKAFLGRVARREWTVDMAAVSPADMAVFEWLADYGQPPFVYYPDDAALHNVLSPAYAAFAPGTHTGLDVGLVEVEPGVHVKAVAASGDNFSLPYRDGTGLDRIPIASGPITVSAWMRGGTVSGDTQFSVVWRSVAGDNISTASTRFPGTAGFTRRHVTLTPPPGAAAITLQIWAQQTAGLAVSLTDHLTDYAPGRGARRAVVHGLSRSLIAAHDRLTLEGASFTVSEVG